MISQDDAMLDFSDSEDEYVETVGDEDYEDAEEEEVKIE